MASWKGKALVIAMVAGQLLVGLQTGRALFLGHCHSPAEGHGHAASCDHRTACESAELCLVLLADDHAPEPGHDHHCRCPHVHYRGECSPAISVRHADAFRRTGATAATPPPFDAGCTRVMGGASAPPFGPDWHVARSRQSVCSVRLLI